MDDTHGLPAMTQLVFDGGDYPVDGDAKLEHGVAVAEGDLFVVEGVEVHGDAEGGADFVLAAVAAADALGVVEEGVEALADEPVDAAGGGHEALVAAEGENGDGDGGQGAVEFENVSGFGLAGGFLGGNGLFLVGVEEEDEGGPVCAAGGFDDVGVESFLGLGRRSR